MCYISIGLGLNFCFPLLKWADSCYSKRDDIWRPGTKFCRTYDCYWTNIKPLSLSLSLSLSLYARAWRACAFAFVWLHHPHLSFMGYLLLMENVYITHNASWKVPSIMPPCLKTCLCGLETLSYLHAVFRTLVFGCQKGSILQF